MGKGNSVINPVGNNFLGTGGTPLNKPLSFVSPLNPGFLGGGMTGRVGRDALTMGLGEFTQKNPFGIPGNPIASVFGNGTDNSTNKNISGPFSLDPAQFNADRAAINQEGQNQYEDTLKGIGDVSAANTQRAKDLFGQMLPDIAENAQAAHLYDSSGYGNEVARQQSNIASQVASDEAEKKLSALSGLQGFQTGALQRGLSLEDFINQANVSKTIGAQMAPPPPSGKSQFGTVAQGVGALAPWAKATK